MQRQSAAETAPAGPDIARLEASPLLRKDITYAGFVYDVANGRMRPLAAPAS